MDNLAHGEVRELASREAIYHQLRQEAIQTVERYRFIGKAWTYLHSAVAFRRAAADSRQLDHDLAILEVHGLEIASRLAATRCVIELGLGDASKTTRFFRAWQRIFEFPIEREYIAIDIQDDLRGEIRRLAQQLEHVRVSGVVGLFDDALKHLRPRIDPKLFICWGSTLLNTSVRDSRPPREQHAALLKAMEAGDFLLFSQDSGHGGDEDMARSYRSKSFQEFLQGVFHDPFDAADWSISGQLVQEPRCFSHSLVARRDVDIGQTHFETGQAIEFFSSIKLKEEQVLETCRDLGLRVVGHWSTEETTTAIYLCQKPFARAPS